MGVKMRLNKASTLKHTYIHSNNQTTNAAHPPVASQPARPPAHPLTLLPSPAGLFVGLRPVCVLTTDLVASPLQALGVMQMRSPVHFT